jgi:DNA invertase Pin-like site-specific DNA recombinase
MPRGQDRTKRAVIYCRVSTDDQCCSRQEQDLTQYAERAGYQVVGVFKETASGGHNERPERKKVLDLVRTRKVDVILVTELTRWGRSTQDLLDTFQLLQSRKVSLIAQTGIEFDLSTPMGKLIATFMSGLAEFERDLIRERVKSGIAAAKARGQHHGRRSGSTTLKVAQVESKVLQLVEQGKSYRAIAHSLGINKNTITRIVRDNRQT